jgi:signal transduction histidine kinase
MELQGGNAFPNHREHPLLIKDSKAALDLLHLEDNDIDATIFLGAAARCRRNLVVRRVSTLREFKDALLERAPDLICADHLLPDGSALDAMKIRSTLCPESPVIVITGAGEEEVAVEYMKSGAADYLSKKRLDQFPLSLDNVLEAYRNRALRHLAERETERLNKELLALIRHVEGERDEEKRSLSRDIHDQLGQELTALKLGLFWIDRQMGEDDIDKDATRSKLIELVDLNTQVIQQVRDIARSLRPVVLDQVGLSAGLETLVQDFNKREQALCGLNMDDIPDLPDEVRTDVFRIVQEGLTNIARHSEATFAYVRLRCPEGRLQLELGDNGKGMPNLSGDIRPIGLGMVGMRERVRNHGGSFSVSSLPDGGTSLVIDIPLTTKA